VADHLTANLAGITQVSGSLRVLGNEFAAITQVADVREAAGSAELAAALTDFATGWSDKRDALIRELRDKSGLAAQAVAEYTRTDATLARALPGDGAGAGIASSMSRVADRGREPRLVAAQRRQPVPDDRLLGVPVIGRGSRRRWCQGGVRKRTSR
jgi:hypothetical protein